MSMSNTKKRKHRESEGEGMIAPRKDKITDYNKKEKPARKRKKTKQKPATAETVNNLYWPGRAPNTGPDKKRPVHKIKKEKSNTIILERLDQMSAQLTRLEKERVGVPRTLVTNEREKQCKTQLESILESQLGRLLEGKEKWTPLKNRMTKQRQRKQAIEMTDEQVIDTAASLTTVARHSYLENYLSSFRAWRTFCS